MSCGTTYPSKRCLKDSNNEMLSELISQPLKEYLKKPRQGSINFRKLIQEGRATIFQNYLQKLQPAMNTKNTAYQHIQ